MPHLTKPLANAPVELNCYFFSPDDDDLDVLNDNYGMIGST
ncbi:hypothetical protein [Bythopirellula goksoeyrii]|nr:hypothetical protein [Bythopirellula goksoeyrii]